MLRARLEGKRVRLRDPQTLDRWFAWSSHSMVVNLSDDRLLEEET